MWWLWWTACRPEATDTDAEPSDVGVETGETPPSHSATGSGSPTGHTGLLEDPPTAVVTVADAPYQILEKRFSVTLSREAPTTLQCLSPQDPAEDHRLALQGSTEEVALHGLLAETAYDCALWWPRVGGVSLWTGQVTTEALPEDLPEFVVSGDAASASLDDGYVLMSHWFIDRQRTQRLVVADGQGRVRWFMTFLDARAGLTGEWLGDLLVSGGGDSEPPALRDLSGQVLFEGPAAEKENRGWHHEALRTPEGWVLGLHSVPDPSGFIGFAIRVYDPADGAEVWSFDSRDHASELPPPDPGDLDPYHANAVSWVEDLWGPAVWVSLRGQERLLRIDRNTREITHLVGPETGWSLVDAAGAPLAAGSWFWQQHDPEIRGDLLLVFDNGVTRPTGGKTSRVTQYRILDGSTLQRLWSWSEPGWFEPNMGSVQTLPSGNVVVGSGHDVDSPFAGGLDRVGFVAEIDGPGQRVVWRMDFGDPHHSLYRAQHLDGCALFANVRACPSLAER
jgi:hypothetical protein